MRDREAIDSELRLIALARRSIREQGGQPSYREADALLDERLGHRPEASGALAAEACDTRVVGDPGEITPHRRKPVLRRFGPRMALSLSLLGVANVFVVVMFAVHHPRPSAEPTVIPPSAVPSEPVAPREPVAPKPPAPPSLEAVDMAFVAALKHDGVPVPSNEYVMTHGHGVCDFLTRQPNFAEAVGFVQRSSIWDANQSAEFTAGAIVSYCPQYEPAGPGETQQAYQNALSDLQAIEGKLQGIQGNLQGIRDDLQAIPGHQ